MNKAIFNVIKNLFCGMVIGVANIIPGISGGTMAVVLGIYDELIGSISNIKKDMKKSVQFLALIGIGAGVAILLSSRGISYLLENYAMITNFFFVGIIIGSAPMIYKRATEDSFKPFHIIPCIVTFLIMIAMILVPSETHDVMIQRNLTIVTGLEFFVAGIVSAVCMLLPGISGSFVMLLLGTYASVTAAISEFNLKIIAVVGLGAAVGLIFGAKLINFVLKKFPQATYFSIFGFVLGSIPVIIEKVHSSGNLVFDGSFVVALLFVGLGIAISAFFDSPFIQKLTVK